MAHKKYYGYKPKFEHYQVVLYEKKGKVGDEINIVFTNGRCSINHYYWGSELDYEYNRDGEVEHNLSFDEENTKLLMLRTGTKNGKDLMDAMYQRFNKEKYNAASKIREWCDKKGIRYNTHVWY